MIPQETGKFIKASFKKGPVVCLSGAGISAESGVPTFRGEGGLWMKYPPETYAYPEGIVSVLRQHPRALADFVCDFYSALLNARPNQAHLALTLLEKSNVLQAIITQNIDNLHQESGSRSVIELHGNAFRIRCNGCGKTFSLEKERIAEFTKLLAKERDSRLGVMRVISRYFPRCAHCGERFRTDIVLFGEMLPEDTLKKAYEVLDGCSVLLIVGSSLLVYPAASLPLYAKQKGAWLIEINNEPSALSSICDYFLKGSAGMLLPEIVRLMDT
jgi:NAD-dependent deacetylase